MCHILKLLVGWASCPSRSSRKDACATGNADYLKLNYPITLYPEPEGGYTVMIKDLPGCISQGDTLEEAMENIQDAKSAWLETAFEYQDEIPLPSR